MRRAAYRFRLFAVCLGLMALAFVQDPGMIAADTKLDLTLNPSGFLQRAAHMWDHLGFFGQLQNQAYGYFFPMGSFFALGELLELPGWVVQRLWWSLILIVGFLGAVRLARLLGVSSPLARVLGGLAFVFGVRFLSTLGPISSEAWPAALMPWTLVPLLQVDRLGARKAGLRSGLVLLAAGGVNAVATLALCPLPALWLVTRRWDRTVARLAGWWALGVILACTWWLVPLMLLGKYSPPFLDWIESASITALFTHLPSILRGSTDWVAYVADPSGPVWPSGWSIVTSAVVLAAVSVLAGLGIFGLSRWPLPDRWFLTLALVLGVALTGMGHTGAMSGLGAGWVQSLLDGPLAPFRNTHKFQPIVSLIIALGFARAVMIIAPRLNGPLTEQFVGYRFHKQRIGALAAVSTLMVTAAWPLFDGRITSGRSYLSVPNYWREVAAWLDSPAHRGRALIVPGAAFGDYLWGRPQDEPLQALGSTPWGVRDAVPLTSAGNIRLLDEFESRIANGQGSSGLSEALARSGVRWLIVRNDLDDVSTSAPRKSLVRRALRQSPGLSPKEIFGPLLGGYTTDSFRSPDSQIPSFSAVEIWEVKGSVAPDRALQRDGVALRPAGDAARVAGGPEALPALGDAGLLAGRPVSIAAPISDGSQGNGEAPLITTDTLRRVEVNFGRMRENATATMTADDDFAAPRPVHDYLSDSLTPSTTRLPDGESSLSASSSRAEADSVTGIDPAHSPAAALDGDPATSWRSVAGKAEGEWWQADWAEPRALGGTMTIRFVADGTTGAAPRIVSVITDTGTASTTVNAEDGPQEISLPTGSTKTVRVRLEEAAKGRRAVSFGIREVSIQGVPAQMPGSEVAPAGSTDPVSAAVISARPGERGGCVVVSSVSACDPYMPRQGEDRAGLRRIVDLPDQSQLSVRVRPRPGPALNEIIDSASSGMRLSATSATVPDPAGRAAAAADGDPGTTWVAAASDQAPALTIDLPEPRYISGIRIENGLRAPASSPFQIFVDLGSREVTYYLDKSGLVQLPPELTSRIKIRFGTASPYRGPDPVAGRIVPYPVGVSELELRGADDLRLQVEPGLPVSIPCGKGPEIQVGGSTVSTSLSTTVGALMDDRVLTAQPCQRTVSAGQRTEVIAKPSESLLVDQVSFVPEAAALSRMDLGQPLIRKWEPTARDLEIPPADAERILELGENANAGWVATWDGKTLEPVVADGWRQAWKVPAEASGSITLRFAPDSSYRLGLMVGGIMAMALVLLALFSPSIPGSALVTAVPPALARLSILLVIFLAASGVVGAVVALATMVATRARPALGRASRLGAWAALVGLAGLADLVWTWPERPPTGFAWVSSAAAVCLLALAANPLGIGKRQREQADPVEPIEAEREVMQAV